MKKFYISENNDRDLRLSETEIPDFRKSKVKTFENRNPRLSEVESADFRESKPNNNKYNNTDFNYTEKNNTESSDTEIISYPILSIVEMRIALLPCLHQKALIRYDTMDSEL